MMGGHISATAATSVVAMTTVAITPPATMAAVLTHLGLRVMIRGALITAATRVHVR